MRLSVMSWQTQECGLVMLVVCVYMEGGEVQYLEVFEGFFVVDWSALAILIHNATRILYIQHTVTYIHHTYIQVTVTHNITQRSIIYYVQYKPIHTHRYRYRYIYIYSNVNIVYHMMSCYASYMCIRVVVGLGQRKENAEGLVGILWYSITFSKTHRHAICCIYITPTTCCFPGLHG